MVSLTRNHYVAHMPDVTPESDLVAMSDAPTVERTEVFDAPIERVLDALRSADLLSAWLGPWTQEPDQTGAAHVTTDDGTRRRVVLLPQPSPNEVVWRWSPGDAPGHETEVHFTVTSDGDRTRLTVIETPTWTATASASARSAAATAPTVPWLRAMMALGAVLAFGSLVAT